MQHRNSLTVLLLLDWLPYQSWRGQRALQFIYKWREDNWIHSIPKSVSAKWNKNSPVVVWTRVTLFISSYMFNFTTKLELTSYRFNKLVKLATVVEGDQKAPFWIATTPRCRGGRYSFPWIASILPLIRTVYCWVLARRYQVPFLKALVWRDLLTSWLPSSIFEQYLPEVLPNYYFITKIFF